MAHTWTVAPTRQCRTRASMVIPSYALITPDSEVTLRLALAMILSPWPKVRLSYLAGRRAPISFALALLHSSRPKITLSSARAVQGYWRSIRWPPLLWRAVHLAARYTAMRFWVVSRPVSIQCFVEDYFRLCVRGVASFFLAIDQSRECSTKLL